MAVATPVSLVISCADGNTELTATKWSSWSATSATGATTFALNLCTPNCAASPMTLFPRSTVRLCAPVATKNGAIFSRIEVTYQRDGKAAKFTTSWTGDTNL
jgi:hypothetical protein